MAVPNLTRKQAAERAELLRVQAYDVALDLTDGAGRAAHRLFRSRTTVRFAACEPGRSTVIDLIADRLHKVTLNGRPVDVADYTPETGILLTGVAADNTLVVDADCVFTNTGEGLHRFVDPVDGEVYLYTQFETADAKRMYACFDQPDLKATFALQVTAPAHWHCVSAGRVEAIQAAEGGARRTTFATTKRISPYVTSLVAGPYHRATDRHGDIDLGIYCRASLAEHLDAGELFAVTKQGFDFYHRAFDYPYPFGKYDQCFVPEFNAGAMENAGCVTILEDYVFRSKVTDAAYERRAETLLHEMAHMWFGDLVTMRWWDDLWLNESFATYASTLCQAEVTRWRNAWATFANTEKTWAYHQDQLPTTHPIAADIPDVQAVEVNFDGITYAKGASVLKQLAAYVGTDAFLDAMKVYFPAHEYDNATLADLLAVLEKSSGRDLSGWSAQWLQTAGINTMRADFDVDGDGRYSSFSIVQTAPGGHNVLRDPRLAVGLYDSEPLGRVHRVEIDVAGERTDVPELIGRPAVDLVMLNDDDLTYCKIRLDDRSLGIVTERIGTLVEPLPRALAWAAAWDMTRDAELPARDWVRLVIAGAQVERTSSVVQSLHLRTRSALARFVAPDWAPTGWAMLADKAADSLRTAEPGSDHQLAWARLLAVASRSAEHVALVRRILDGTEQVPGLAVDAELRWSLLYQLVARGAADDAEIDAEAKRDGTAAGVRNAETARACRPTEPAKERAWRQVTEDDTLPNAAIKAIMRGFHHPTQTELLTPYVQRYFGLLDRVWAERTNDVAQSIVIGLFPSVVIQSTVDAADAWLAGDSRRPAPLRRLVAEERDDLARALRAQAVDAGAGAHPAG
ncbi:MAG: aminopeptidase N [Mycobacteriales bacterium]